MAKRILVVLGNPNADSYCGAMAKSYMEGARIAGHEVQLISLGDLSLDPILHKGYGDKLSEFQRK